MNMKNNITIGSNINNNSNNKILDLRRLDLSYLEYVKNDHKFNII